MAKNNTTMKVAPSFHNIIKDISKEMSLSQRELTDRLSKRAKEIEELIRNGF